MYIKGMFKELDRLGYGAYLEKYPFHRELGIDLKVYIKEKGGLNKKRVKNKLESVDINNKVPYPVELDDLIRLHFLVTSRKVTTILEFGVGKSTKVFDHALSINESKYNSYVTNNLRRSNIFECHSVDTSRKWIKTTKKQFQTEHVRYHHAKCNVSTFNGRICTMYKKLPNICPDLIYLDAPDQYSPNGNVRGISTRHPDRLPMAGDLLAIEHFLLPGTLIVVDGRTANARFLKANFQRSWSYQYFKNFDQHFFELDESPLGVWNNRQINFTTVKDK
jgi:hypothetical protein